MGWRALSSSSPRPPPASELSLIRHNLFRSQSNGSSRHLDGRASRPDYQVILRFADEDGRSRKIDRCAWHAAAALPISCCQQEVARRRGVVSRSREDATKTPGHTVEMMASNGTSDGVVKHGQQVHGRL